MILIKKTKTFLFFLPSLIFHRIFVSKNVAHSAHYSHLSDYLPKFFFFLIHDRLRRSN